MCSGEIRCYIFELPKELLQQIPVIWYVVQDLQGSDTLPVPSQQHAIIYLTNTKNPVEST
jgi:hypothetical protein